MDNSSRTIVVIGGGLAGLYSAWKCAYKQSGGRTILLERSPYLGGRCMSFFDAPSGRWLDNCPHVYLNCCYNVRQFFTQTGLIQYWQTEQEFYFYPPDQPAVKPCRFKETKWLPGLLRLMPSLLNLNYLSLYQKYQIVLNLLAMKREARREKVFKDGNGAERNYTFDVAEQRSETRETRGNQMFVDWLDDQHVPEIIRTLFYEPVVLSALSCSLEKPSYEIVQKVFVSSFFESRNNWICSLPTISLREMFDVKLANSLKSLGVDIRRNCTVMGLEVFDNHVTDVVLSTGERISVDCVRLDVNYPSAMKLFNPVSCLKSSYQTESISCVHFWTDKPIISTPHGVFPCRTIQWIFSGGTDKLGYYYRAVISGTNCWQTKKEQFEAVVRQELSVLNPKVTVKRLKSVHWRNAIHVPSADWFRTLRNWKSTCVLPDNLIIGGDWSNDQWPATMESTME